MEIPGLIILINDSITTATQTFLATDTGIQPNELVPLTPFPSTVQGIDTQLQINETITTDEFNARVAADPNYPTVVHLNRLRILVISTNFHDTTNRHLYDVVMFVKQGLASVEKCLHGGPKFTLPTQRINIFNLIYGIKHSGTTICCPFPIDTCPPKFPPFICPPQIQTIENPRSPEHAKHHFPEGLGALELFGAEALQENGIDESAFGGSLRPRHHKDHDEDDECHCDDDDD